MNTRKIAGKTKAKIYAPICGTWEAPCGGRKKSSKTASHRLLRTHLKDVLRKELMEIEK